MAVIRQAAPRLPGLHCLRLLGNPLLRKVPRHPGLADSLCLARMYAPYAADYLRVTRKSSSRASQGRQQKSMICKLAEVCTQLDKIRSQDPWEHAQCNSWMAGMGPQVHASSSCHTCSIRSIHFAPALSCQRRDWRRWFIECRRRRAPGRLGFRLADCRAALWRVLFPFIWISLHFALLVQSCWLQGPDCLERQQPMAFAKCWPV